MFLIAAIALMAVASSSSPSLPANVSSFFSSGGVIEAFSTTFLYGDPALVVVLVVVVVDITLGLTEIVSTFFGGG